VRAGKTRLTAFVNEAPPTTPPNSSQPGVHALILEPDEQLAREIVAALNEASPGASAQIATNLAEAQRLALEHRPALFVLDLDATRNLDQEFLYDLRTSHPNARAVVLTAVHLAEQREKVAGLGAIHFLEKPFPRADFVELAGALLSPDKSESERFQGTLSDLHIADIIQLKCMSGATSALEFTGPQGEKARVYFEHGQVVHSTSPGKEGLAAFNEIVDWKGGMISEVPTQAETPRTIDLDWQVLLMEAVRKLDETRNVARKKAKAAAGITPATQQKILVIDDSLMLLSFVKEILTEAKYQVAIAATAEEGLRECHTSLPDLILLDYVLPDMKGDEVCRKLIADPVTSKVPVVYMSGFGAELHAAPSEIPNVIGSLTKPFTSDLLRTTIEKYLPPIENPAPIEEPETEVATVSETIAEPAEPRVPAQMPRLSEFSLVEEKPSPMENATPAAGEPPAHKEEPSGFGPVFEPALPRASFPVVAAPASPSADPIDGAFFCGDSSFFSLNWALQTIKNQRLTGTLRAHWDKAPVELLARDGNIVLVTSRDPELYCPEAPITLLNVDSERNANARAIQRETGCPLFVTLANEGLIIREPALQLVQHYGQKLFAQLWTAQRVRFAFEKGELPAYARDLTAAEDGVDHWALSTLRFIQYPDLSDAGEFDPTVVPAYTRTGYERVQHLSLTVAEAQFASQFNGKRSLLQIARNLRLDQKFARVTLFRFHALEIVELWPIQTVEKPERRGFFGRRAS
jgi:DNA-binding response OmpR family regulator